MKNASPFFVAVFLSCIAVLGAGCSNNSRKIPENFDYGNWTDSTYRNDFFGFSITLPEGWNVASAEEFEADIRAGRDILAMSEDAKKRMKAADITTANLFHVSQYTQEEAEKAGTNSAITSLAENLSKQNINLQQYAELTRRNLAQSLQNVVITPGVNRTIGGREFAVTEIKFTAFGVQQEQLLCLKNGFGVCFGVTWTEDSEKKLLDDIMATLKWD